MGGTKVWQQAQARKYLKKSTRISLAKILPYSPGFKSRIPSQKGKSLFSFENF